MARTGRPKTDLVLTDEERLTLRAAHQPAQERPGHRHAGQDRDGMCGGHDEPPMSPASFG